MEAFLANPLYYMLIIDGVGIMCLGLLYLVSQAFPKMQARLENMAPNLFVFGFLSIIGAGLIQTAQYAFGG